MTLDLTPLGETVKRLEELEKKATRLPFALETGMQETWINGHKHYFWEIYGPDMGVAVVILPEEDDTKKDRKECLATAEFIVNACNAAPLLLSAAKALMVACEALEEHDSECLMSLGGGVCDCIYGKAVAEISVLLSQRTHE